MLETRSLQRDTGPGERIPDSEARVLPRLLAEAKRRVVDAAVGSPARRDAHPKMHGCVRATFRVLDGLPAELRQGVFAEIRSWPAWVRFSNGNATPGPDGKPDGRGMAIKLMGVAGSPSGTQDFVLINHPAFFVRDAADYLDFTTASPEWRFFVPGLNPLSWRLRELRTALAITRHSVSNPLSARYFSMAPFCCGERAAKWSAKPLPPDSQHQGRDGEHFLRANLAAHLASCEARFEFQVQLQTDPTTQPVEDPRIVWNERAAPFVTVAELVIPPQSFDTPARDAFGERLSFTPWHCVPAHRPLGGINRIRRDVYDSISRLRHELTGAAEAEPTQDDPGEAAPLSPTGLGAPAAALPLSSKGTPMTDTAMTMTIEKPTPKAPPRAADEPGTLKDWLQTNLLKPVGSAIDGWAWLSGEASDLVVNQACSTTRTRPHPWSTVSDYVSWRGLTDRTYLARHLPPKDAPVQPPAAEIQKLFARPDHRQRLSEKSTCLFPAFAQYLTDGFLRTRMDDRRRTTSNHEIDLCPLYGRTHEQTLVLRLRSGAPGTKGRLRSTMIQGEEWPPLLFPNGAFEPDKAFDGLDFPLGVDGPNHPASPTRPGVPAERRATLFAIGGDRANSTPFTAMMNTLFLREHNRIAGELESRNPSWDDDRVFETARNITIPLFIKIVVEHYINHITPLPFAIRANPAVAWNAPWNRPNWMTVEFSLLYRWHSLMPDTIQWGRNSIPIGEFTLDNRPLLEVGLDAAFSAAASQPAGELGAFNTARALLPIEDFAVAQARSNRVAPYNDYREAFGMGRAKTFAEISSNPQVAAELQRLYGTPENVEFYPGLFAEDRVEEGALPGLLMRMVALDAFTQALTNPLLSEHVWNEGTFTEWGFKLIKETSNLGQILERNVPKRGQTPIEMTQPGWVYGSDD